jgi:hypothetical protein
MVALALASVVFFIDHIHTHACCGQRGEEAQDAGEGQRYGQRSDAVTGGQSVSVGART